MTHISEIRKQMGLRGRKTGAKNRKTVFKEQVQAEVRKKLAQRLFNVVPSLITAQVSLAKGQQFLYRIDTHYEQGPKGTKIKVRSKPKLVRDKVEISAYIDSLEGGEQVNDDVTYYFITTKEPDNAAIDSLLDRVLGRPKSEDSMQQGQTFNNYGMFLNQPVKRLLDDESARRLGLKKGPDVSPTHG